MVSNLSPGSTKCLTKIDFSEALFCVNYDFVWELIWRMKSLNYKQPAFEQCTKMRGDSLLVGQGHYNERNVLVQLMSMSLRLSFICHNINGDLVTVNP